MNVLNVPVGKFEFTDFSSMRDKTDQSRSITIHDNFTDFGEKVFIRIHGGSVYVCPKNCMGRSMARSRKKMTSRSSRTRGARDNPYFDVPCSRG